jgi:hypothetical protein
MMTAAAWSISLSCTDRSRNLSKSEGANEAENPTKLRQIISAIVIAILLADPFRLVQGQEYRMGRRVPFYARLAEYIVG